MQRRVSRIFFQKGKVLLGNLLDRWREFMEAIPETSSCFVHLKVLELSLTLLVESFLNEEIQLACS